MSIFRELGYAEIAKFKQFAHDNFYKYSSMELVDIIKDKWGVYHPAIIRELLSMIADRYDSEQG